MVSHNISHDISHDLSHDLSHDISHDISHAISHDISHDIPHDISHDIPHDISTPCVEENTDINNDSQVIVIDDCSEVETVPPCVSAVGNSNGSKKKTDDTGMMNKSVGCTLPAAKSTTGSLVGSSCRTELPIEQDDISSSKIQRDNIITVDMFEHDIDSEVESNEYEDVTLGSAMSSNENTNYYNINRSQDEDTNENEESCSIGRSYNESDCVNSECSSRSEVISSENDCFIVDDFSGREDTSLERDDDVLGMACSSSTATITDYESDPVTMHSSSSRELSTTGTLSTGNANALDCVVSGPFRSASPYNWRPPSILPSNRELAEGNARLEYVVLGMQTQTANRLRSLEARGVEEDDADSDYQRLVRRSIRWVGQPSSSTEDNVRSALRSRAPERAPFYFRNGSPPANADCSSCVRSRPSRRSVDYLRRAAIDRIRVAGGWRNEYVRHLRPLGKYATVGLRR